jgi:hypothetical protein
MYKEKYLKYKTKYLELKNQIGGDLKLIRAANYKVPNETDIYYIEKLILSEEKVQILNREKQLIITDGRIYLIDPYLVIYNKIANTLTFYPIQEYNKNKEKKINHTFTYLIYSSNLQSTLQFKVEILHLSSTETFKVSENILVLEEKIDTQINIKNTQNEELSKKTSIASILSLGYTNFNFWKRLSDKLITTISSALTEDASQSEGAPPSEGANHPDSAPPSEGANHPDSAYQAGGALTDTKIKDFTYNNFDAVDVDITFKNSFLNPIAFAAAAIGISTVSTVSAPFATRLEYRKIFKYEYKRSSVMTFHTWLQHSKINTLDSQYEIDKYGGDNPYNYNILKLNNNQIVTIKIKESIIYYIIKTDYYLVSFKFDDKLNIAYFYFCTIQEWNIKYNNLTTNSNFRYITENINDKIIINILELNQIIYFPYQQREEKYRYEIENIIGLNLFKQIDIDETKYAAILSLVGQHDTNSPEFKFWETYQNKPRKKTDLFAKFNVELIN